MLPSSTKAVRSTFFLLSAIFLTLPVIQQHLAPLNKDSDCAEKIANFFNIMFALTFSEIEKEVMP